MKVSATKFLCLEDKYIPADCLQQMAAVFIAIKQAEEADKGDDYEYEEIKDSY